MEVRIVQDGIVDRSVDIFRRVIIQTDNCGPQIAGANPGRYHRVPDRLMRVFPQIFAEPVHAFVAHDPIRIDACAQIAQVGNVTAHNNGGFELILAQQLAHATDFQQVGGNAADSHDVVAAFPDFLDETIQTGKIK